MGLISLLFAVLSGSQIGFVLMMIIYNKAESVILSIIVFTASVALFIVISCLIHWETYKRIRILFGDESRRTDFLKKCEYELNWSCDSVLKSKLSLLMCEFYLREGSIEKAYNYLKRVNPYKSYSSFNRCFLLDSQIKLKYYLTAVRLNLSRNRIIEAQTFFENGSRLFERFKFSEHAFEINSTLGMLENSKGLYSEAEAYIARALDLCENGSVRESLKLVMAEILIKSLQTEKAQELLGRIDFDKLSAGDVIVANELLQKISHNGTS